MTRARFWTVAVLVMFAWAGSAWAWNPAVPLHEPLASDEQTAALWRFDRVQNERVPDLSGNGHDARFIDGPTLTSAKARLSAGFQQVLAMPNHEGNRLPRIEAPGLGQTFVKGSFTIEVLLRYGGEGGLIFQAGRASNVALQWGIVNRDAGAIELRWVSRGPDGQPKRLSLYETGLFEKVGGASSDRFYRYALTFDGSRTFAMCIDGQKVFEHVMPEADGAGIAIEPDVVQVGRVSSWVSDFDGDIAEVRLSKGLRPFAVQQTYPKGLADAGPVYRFDMGPPESPVAEGALPVLPGDAYTPQRGYGWTPAAKEGHDAWFTGGWLEPTPEGATKTKTRQARNWLERDGLIVESNAQFRADLPPGRYAVSVTVGHMSKDTTTAAIEANGVLLGKNLKTTSTYIFAPDEWTARGLVDVTDQGLLVTVKGTADKTVSVLGIEVWPHGTLPIQRESGRLVWSAGAKAEPAFEQVAKAYAAGDWTAAYQAARKIENSLAKATTLAWIVGHPHHATEEDANVADEILAILAQHLQKTPDDRAAWGLFDAAHRFLHGDMGVVTSRVSDQVFGITGSRLMEALEQCVQVNLTEPLAGQAQMVTGTVLYWRMMENGGTPLSTFPAPSLYLEEVLRQYPHYGLARIYMGQRVPLAKTIDIPPQTPQWAALEHRALVRIMDTIRYWTDQRQDAQGLMGGGLGDDVETLRWWSIAHLVADDEKVRQGWRNLANSAWLYTNKTAFHTGMEDVEHGAEPFGDSHTFLPFLNFGTPQFEETLSRQYLLFAPLRDLWTAQMPQGFRMFRSYYFTSKAIEEKSAYDVAYNVRAVQPLLIYNFFRRDPEITTVLRQWADSWVEAFLSDRNGKPAGIAAIMISYPDRALTTPKYPWYDPGYYKYPQAYASEVYNLLLAVYELTGDEKYLQPVRAGLKLLRENPKPSDDQIAKLQPGSLLWALQGTPIMKSAGASGKLVPNPAFTGRALLTDAGARYRVVTGDRSFDDVLAAYGPAYIRFVIAHETAKTSDEIDQGAQPMFAELGDALNELDYDWEMRTTEPRSTDRVRVPGTELVNSMATGLTGQTYGPAGRERSWPIFGVSWRSTGTDVSMLITANSRSQLAGYLYNFDPKPKDIGAQIWRLNPGTYRLTLTSTPGWTPALGTPGSPAKPITEQAIEIKKLGQEIRFTLPPRQTLWLDIRP